MKTRTDKHLIRARGRSRRYLNLSFAAPAARSQAGRLPVNVAFVLDRSGSMQGDKLQRAREAVSEALRLLRPQDRFSVVIYDHAVDTLVPSTPATEEARQLAGSELASVCSRGCTDLGAGWLRGCEQIASFLADDSVGKCLLLTDGLANRGITASAELASHAQELRTRGVLTSTFGVGADFDECLLGELAQAGGGNFYFLESPARIPELMAGELGETLEVTARAAKLRVNIPAGIEPTVLGDFRHEATPAGVTIDLGNLVSGQDVSITLALRFPEGVEGSGVEATWTAEDLEGVLGGVGGACAWTYAAHLENDQQPRDIEVCRQAARLIAAHARRAANEANRRHEFDRARGIIHRAVKAITLLAGGDEVIERLIHTLQDEARHFSEPLTPMERKIAYSLAVCELRGKESSGRTRRRSDG